MWTDRRADQARTAISHKPDFASLRSKPPATPESAAESMRPAAARRSSREGRKQVAGFLAPEMSLAMHMLAFRQGRSLQALMAKAFGDVLRKHGERLIGG